MVASIESIPPEVLLQVFGRLEGMDLVRVAQVCREWRALADDYSLWRPLYVHCFSDKPIAPILSWKELYVIRAQGGLWRSGGIVTQSVDRLQGFGVGIVTKSGLLLSLRESSEAGCVTPMKVQRVEDLASSTALSPLLIRRETIVLDEKGRRLFAASHRGDEIVGLSLETGEVLSRWQVPEAHTCTHLRYPLGCDRLLGVCRRANGAIEGPVLVSWKPDGVAELLHDDRAALLAYDQKAEVLHYLAGRDNPGRYVPAAVDLVVNQQSETPTTSSIDFTYAEGFLGRNRFDFREALYDPDRRLCVGTNVVPKVGPRWTQFRLLMMSYSLGSGESKTTPLLSMRPEYWIRQIALLLHPLTGDVIFYGERSECSCLAIASPTEEAGGHYSMRYQCMVQEKVYDVSCHPDQPLVFELVSTCREEADQHDYLLNCRDLETGELSMEVPVEIEGDVEMISIASIFGNSIRLLVRFGDGRTDLLTLSICRKA